MGQSRTGRDRVRMRVWLLLCLLIGSLNAKEGRLASSTRTETRSLLIHDPWRPRPTPSSSGSSGSIRTSGEAGGTSILSGEDAGGESIGGDDIFGKGGRSASSARTGSSSLIMYPPYTPRRTTPRSIRTSGQAGGTSIFDAQESAGGTSIFGKSDVDDDDLTESMESNEFDDSDEMIEDEPEEVGQAATIEEQVSSLRNETQIKKQTLTRLEAFFERLERRILRLEAANNGTRGVTESVPESMTSPAPETTTNLPCCHKIKLKSRFRAPIRSFLGVYVYNKLEPEDLSVEVDFEVFYYEKLSEGRETLSNACQNELAGFNSIHDECGEEKLKFESGFTGSCITGPKLYTVHWYNEGQGFWEEDDSLTIVCVD